jgi:uncharacterized protein YecT (DUF1311 family)
MLRHLTVPFLLVTVTPITIIFSQVAPKNIVAQVNCDPTGTSLQVKQCAINEYQLLDQNLNQSYDTLLSQLSGERKQNFVLAQRSWLVFREKTCNFQASNTKHGGLDSFLYTNCLKNLTQNRIANIKKYF